MRRDGEKGKEKSTMCLNGKERRKIKWKERKKKNIYSRNERVEKCM